MLIMLYIKEREKLKMSPRLYDLWKWKDWPLCHSVLGRADVKGKTKAQFWAC